MGGKTKIEWTNGGSTWNPIRGCSRVSSGCTRCYAERVAARFSGYGMPYHGLARNTASGPRWTGDIELLPDKLGDPLRWKRPRMIFVNSMSDLFHEGVADYFINRIFAVMALCPQHIFQVLTKRPQRMLAYMNEPGRAGEVVEHMSREAFDEWTLKGRSGRIPQQALLNPDAMSKTMEGPLIQVKGLKWPPANVWMGVSCEDQETADERIPLLAETQAAIRWVSAEPLLGRIIVPEISCLDWVVVGGESGPGARPCDRRWIYQIIRQCEEKFVPVFVKQLGAKSHIDDNGSCLPLKDHKGGDVAEWPPDLRIREYPNIEFVANTTKEGAQHNATKTNVRTQGR